jgi:putative permease
MVPIVENLEERGFSRTMAAAIPFLAFACVMLILALWLFPILAAQIEAFKAQLPQYSNRIKEVSHQWENTAHPWLKELGQNSTLDSVQTYLLTKVSTYFSQIPQLLSALLTVSLLTPFFSFFLLHDGSSLYRNFLRIVPNHLFELMVNVNHSINMQMGQFIRARLIETALISVFMFICLSSINFPYSLIFALSTGLLNLVPYLGPVVAAIPQVILCLISPELRAELVPIILINIGAQIFDTVVLVPLLVAKIVDMHPVVVVLAVILGGQTMGVLGMIISIPLASALKIFMAAYYRYMTHHA